MECERGGAVLADDKGCRYYFFFLSQKTPEILRTLPKDVDDMAAEKPLYTLHCCLLRPSLFFTLPLIHFYSISRRCRASCVSASPLLSLSHSLTTARRVAKPGKY